MVSTTAQLDMAHSQFNLQNVSQTMEEITQLQNHLLVHSLTLFHKKVFYGLHTPQKQLAITSLQMNAQNGAVLTLEQSLTEHSHLQMSLLLMALNQRLCTLKQEQHIMLDSLLTQQIQSQHLQFLLKLPQHILRVLLKQSLLMEQMKLLHIVLTSTIDGTNSLLKMQAKFV